MGEELRRVSMKEFLKKRIAGEQRGAFIVFTALAVWFLMMFVAFAVDFGNYYQHRTRLQNAADAAALAGVAKYADSEPMSEKGRGHLVVLPANITEGQEGQAASFSSGSYTFTQIGGVPSDVHTQAESYVNNNYTKYNPDSGVGMTDSMWNASQESTSSTSSQETSDGYIETTTTTTPKQYCYRVDLEDTVTTFFARIFGVETLPVRVSAMAMLDGKQITTLEEQFVNISEQISKVAANYIWETITKRVGIITDAKTGKTEYTLSQDTNSSGRPPALGEHDNRYFVVTGGGASSRENVVMDPKIDPKNGKIIIGYTEPPDDSKNKGICADPIYYEGDPADWNKFKQHVTTRIFTIDANVGNTDGVMFYDKKDIQVLYLNRDHINQRKGLWEKFTVVNIGKIISCKDAIKSNPLYLRLESEPICMSDVNNGNPAALMVAHGLTINVNLSEADVKNSRQVVFAYDGPDPKRSDYDAPWQSTSMNEVKIQGGSAYHLPGEILKNNEPLLKKYGGDREKVPPEIVQNAMATSGPIEVNIPAGCVLYGAIFAPRSRVILNGGGEIRGFILAREIVPGPNCGSYYLGAREVEMPVLIAERPAGNNYQEFNYRREYIKAEYALASSSDISKLNLTFMALQ